MAEFDQLFTEAVREVHRLDPTRLDIVLAAAARERAVDLAARETQCCSLFQFEFHDDATRADRVRMTVTVPAAHSTVLDGLAARCV